MGDCLGHSSSSLLLHPLFLSLPCLHLSSSLLRRRPIKPLAHPTSYLSSYHVTTCGGGAFPSIQRDLSSDSEANRIQRSFVYVRVPLLILTWVFTRPPLHRLHLWTDLANSTRRAPWSFVYHLPRRDQETMREGKRAVKRASEGEWSGAIQEVS